MISKMLESRRISLIFVIALTVIFNSQANGAGELDSTFSGSAFGDPSAYLFPVGALDGRVNIIRVQPDGKILIGGYFTDANGFAASGIARINPDGTTDTSFKSLDFIGVAGIGGQIFAIALQSDGKILVGGDFVGVDSDARPGIRRLNADGSLDSSFSIHQIPADSTVFDLEIQPDNKILVGGYGVGIFRLNANGTIDNTFAQYLSGTSTSGIADIELQADGKILIGGSTGQGMLRRLTSTGQLDSEFPQFSNIVGGVVKKVKIRPDGKILFVGSFLSVNGSTKSGICLVTSDGVVDKTFNQSNLGPNAAVNDIFLKTDGKLVIAGRFTRYSATARNLIAQINADGTLDTSIEFDTTIGASNGIPNSVVTLPDGTILMGVRFEPSNSLNKTPLVRFYANGITDSSFVPIITGSGTVYKTMQQPDGKILATGKFTFANGVIRKSLARFNPDGSLDTSFVPYFNDTSPIPEFRALAVQADGKVLVGSKSGFGLKRLNPDGTHDTGFNYSSTAWVNDIVPLPNGQILICGDNAGASGFVIKLNNDGSVVGTFSTPQPNLSVNKMLVQPDGKILVGGDFSQIGSSNRGRIARLNPDGSLDNSFNPSGANNSVYDFDLHADGKVVLGGSFTELNGSVRLSIGRLNTDGSLDSGFVQGTNASVYAVKVQPDGKILIGGNMSAVQGTPHNGLARLNSDGTVDSSFNTFANTSVWDINLQTDNKILIGGNFTKIDRLSAVRIARLLNPTVPVKTLFDYDGDGKSDVSVFRSSTNRWYELLSSNSTVTEQTFGTVGDVVAPADYDGDGKTDIGIFRPSTGDWWYLSSVNNVQIQTHWGASGDIPRPSDFDGDGQADFVVFRPGENNWYRFGTTAGISIVNFGLAGDKPVMGDFDGDGKSDVAIYRPSTGTWWFQSSLSGAQLATQFGISSDIPVAADFDGDGKTDFAVYRPSTGVWYILNSSTGQATIVSFGLAEDKPVAADYDGDGKADIAVFRPSTGIWYQLRSTAGFTALQFGISADVPTPNAFVP